MKMANEYELQFGVTVEELARKLYEGMGYKGRHYVNTCDDHPRGGRQTQFDVYQDGDHSTVLFHIQVPRKNAGTDTVINAAKVNLVTREKPLVDLETTLREMLVLMRGRWEITHP